MEQTIAGTTARSARVAARAGGTTCHTSLSGSNAGRWGKAAWSGWRKGLHAGLVTSAAGFVALRDDIVERLIEIHTLGEGGGGELAVTTSVGSSLWRSFSERVVSVSRY